MRGELGCLCGRRGRGWIGVCLRVRKGVAWGVIGSETCRPVVWFLVMEDLRNMEAR